MYNALYRPSETLHASNPACSSCPDSESARCHLYGLQALHPTAAPCELIDAQNTLIDQHRLDASSLPLNAEHR
jgi:hypothetical protein